MNVVKKPTVLLERFPYRYIQVGKLEINGLPDCRIQKVDSYTGRYRDMYLCDNEMQLMTAMEDHDYTCCWLVPLCDGVPARIFFYVKDYKVVFRSNTSSRKHNSRPESEGPSGGWHFEGFPFNPEVS